MPKSTNIFLQEFRSRPLAYGVQIVGIIIVLLNIWLSTKLFPMAQNIDALISRVKAAELEISELKVDSKQDTELLVEVKSMSITLQEVQSRLERIDNRLSKHLGI